MNDYFKVWEKSSSESPSEEELFVAAESLLGIINISRIGDPERELFDPFKSKPKCVLSEFVKVGTPNDELYPLLKEAFKRETGEDWDPKKHFLVVVPTQVYGGRSFVVFELDYSKSTYPGKSWIPSNNK